MTCYHIENWQMFAQFDASQKVTQLTWSQNIYFRCKTTSFLEMYNTIKIELNCDNEVNSSYSPAIYKCAIDAWTPGLQLYYPPLTRLQTHYTRADERKWYLLFISSDELCNIITGLITGKGSFLLLLKYRRIHKRSGHITKATNGSAQSCSYYLGEKGLFRQYELIT